MAPAMADAIAVTPAPLSSQGEDRCRKPALTGVDGYSPVRGGAIQPYTVRNRRNRGSSTESGGSHSPRSVRRHQLPVPSPGGANSYRKRRARASAGGGAGAGGVAVEPR